MSPNTSGYRNFMYRYYRCRSTAGGTPPCSGVRVPAWEIEQFVIQTLNGLDFAAVKHEIEANKFDEFKRWWTGMSDDERRRTLREAVQRVVWHQDTGKIEISPAITEIQENPEFVGIRG